LPLSCNSLFSSIESFCSIDFWAYIPSCYSFSSYFVLFKSLVFLCSLFLTCLLSEFIMLYYFPFFGLVFLILFLFIFFFWCVCLCHIFICVPSCPSFWKREQTSWKLKENETLTTTNYLALFNICEVVYGHIPNNNQFSRFFGKDGRLNTKGTWPIEQSMSLIAHNCS
jgi:hypothetical protein